MHQGVVFACAVGVALAGCVAEKEAMDPRDILGDEMSWGASGGEPQPVEREDSPGGQRKAGSTKSQTATAGDVPASVEQCAAVARHILKLGFEQAISEQEGPQARERLRAERDKLLTESPPGQEIEDATQDCLQWGTTASEAHCLGAARSAEEIEGCAG